jgi:hypothetical protein
MELHRMFQNILLAEYHGTFHDTPSNKMDHLCLTFKTSVDEQEMMSSIYAWTNFSLQDEPWAEFSTLKVAACIPCTYCLV